jgi:phenylpyruvate tautomerase PptA (4-oxalocrotonate tautomerase family)
MPMYQCHCPVGTLSDTVRPEVVKEITRIHCENTGAPSSFVHVVFQDLPAGALYTDNKVDLRTSTITCTIRAGRTVATRQQIMKEISAAWSRLTGQPENQLWIAVFEVNSETVMEFGLVLPAPGGEEAWMAENAAALASAQSANT